MNLTKFLSLLNSSSLYFCRLDLFDDPYEGTHTLPYIEKRKTVHAAHQAKILSEAPAMSKALDMTEDEYKARFDLEKNAAESTRFARELMFVNCWHMNDDESVAMWDLYASADGGIAVQTTFELLRDAFDKDDVDVNIGVLNYIDYKKDKFPEGDGNVFTPMLYKRKSYDHEKELRALIILTPEQQKEKFGATKSGISAHVDLDKLIENIFISPKAPSHIRSLIENVLGKYGLTKPVLQSSLNDPALY